MTPEQINQLAYQSGLLPNLEVYDEDVQAFAALIRNATLEEAALRFDGIDTGGAGFYEAEPANIIRSMK